MKVSAETACVNYANAYKTVALLSEELGDPEYSECTKRGETGDCIDRLFSCPRGPDGEAPRLPEFREAMCPRCVRRLATLDERKIARGRLGAAKRTILIVGKRLLKEVSAPPRSKEE